MASIVLGDESCTTGLAALVYNQWLADTASGFSGAPTAAQIAMIKAQVWAFVNQIGQAVNTAVSGGAGPPTTLVPGERPAGPTTTTNANDTYTFAFQVAAIDYIAVGGAIVDPSNYTITTAFGVSKVIFAAGHIPVVGVQNVLATYFHP